MVSPKIFITPVTTAPGKLKDTGTTPLSITGWEEVTSVAGLVPAQQDPTVPLQILLPIEKEGALKSKINYEIK